MLNKKTLLKKLEKDIKNLENQIEHRKLYNIRNNIIIGFIKVGVVLDYSLPYILASIIIINSRLGEFFSPFVRETIVNRAEKQKMITSTGLEKGNISFDYNYDAEIFCHTTGWKINEYGLYERVITYYKIDDSIDLSDTDNILTMSKQEIEKTFTIIDIQTIQKSSLDGEEEIYNDEMIVINFTELDNENVTTRKETIIENCLGTLLYLVVVAFLGKGLDLAGNIFIKTKIRDNLKELQPRYTYIREKDLEELKKILELKKQNLIMLKDDTLSVVINENKGYTRILRK